MIDTVAKHISVVIAYCLAVMVHLCVAPLDPLT